MVDLWFGDNGDAPAAITALVTLLSSKAAIFHCTPEDQSIHMHILYYYSESERILH